MADLRIHGAGLTHDQPESTLRIHGVGVDRIVPPAGPVTLRIHAIGLSRYPSAPGQDGVYVCIDGTTWTLCDVLVPNAAGTGWDELQIP